MEKVVGENGTTGTATRDPPSQQGTREDCLNGGKPNAGTPSASTTLEVVASKVKQLLPCFTALESGIKDAILSMIELAEREGMGKGMDEKNDGLLPLRKLVEGVRKLLGDLIFQNFFLKRQGIAVQLDQLLLQFNHVVESSCEQRMKVEDVLRADYDGGKIIVKKEATKKEKANPVSVVKAPKKQKVALVNSLVGKGNHTKTIITQKVGSPVEVKKITTSPRRSKKISIEDPTEGGSESKTTTQRGLEGNHTKTAPEATVKVNVKLLAPVNPASSKAKSLAPAVQEKKKDRSRRRQSSEKKEATTENTQHVTTYKYTSGEIINLNADAQKFMKRILTQVCAGGETDNNNNKPEEESAADKQGDNRVKRVIEHCARELKGYFKDHFGPGPIHRVGNPVLAFDETIKVLEEGQFSDVMDVCYAWVRSDCVVVNRKTLSALRERCIAILSVHAKEFYRLTRLELPLSIQSNIEPYRSEWRREPYEVKPYLKLQDYQPAGGEGHQEILPQKLTTTMEGNCERNAVSQVDASALESGSNVDLDKDVEEVDCWGFDCYTRRNVEDAIFDCGAFDDASGGVGDESNNGISENRKSPNMENGNGVKTSAQQAEERPRKLLARERASKAVSDAVAKFIDRALLPAVNEPKENGWDLRRSLRALKEKNSVPSGNIKIRQSCQSIMDRADQVGLNYFRLHPKGRGLVCKNPCGIPASAFVSRYLGEVYSPYRWFELQDGLKKFAPNEELNDFYNIVLERPKEDPSGYDVLYVDAEHKGAIASRMSHSCEPNCKAVVMAKNGRLSISLYTARKIAYGEELTFDYSCITESYSEYRDAICLCSSNGCRGSFLSYADGTAYQEVVKSCHTNLHRNSIILKACSEKLSGKDFARLKEHGFKASLLGSFGANADPGSNKLPDWFIKWVSLTLEYIEVEKNLLPTTLVEAYPKIYTSTENAEIEAFGVRDQRVQNLAITVDKIKYILSQEGQSQKPPLRFLSEEEELEFLWTGKNSIATRVYNITAKPVSNQTASRPSNVELASLLESYMSIMHQRPETTVDAKKKLLAISHLLESFDAENQGKGGKRFAATIDLLRMYGNTRQFFRPEKFLGFLSTGVVQKKHVKYCAAKKPKNFSSLNDDDCIAPKAGKKYNAGFLWGQLIFWYKQTIYQPDASLSAERRGTISLPDVESSKGGSGYKNHQRKAQIEQLKTKPDAMWKTGTIWSFRNESKTYGSPWMDAALANPFGKLTPENCRIKEVFNA